VAAARGAIVITIDNDVLLNGTDAVQRVLDAFAVRPALACANFKILDARGALSSRDWCHPRDPRLFADEAFPTDYVLEGASAFRRDVFLSVGGYWERLFIGHEGLDLALRLLDAGHEVLYWPRVSVTHLASLDARPSSRIYYSFTRNGIWVALRNHRAPAAAFDIAKGLALMAFSSLRAGEWRSFVRGLRDAVLGGPSTLAARRPLRSATYRTLRGIRRLRPSLLAKARRHWQERPI
jgi:GT2 family glycosyltransferase